MVSITKRGNTYWIRVSNGRDSQVRQFFESTTFTPDPARTEKQNQKVLEIFTLKFEEQVKNGKYLEQNTIELYKTLPQLHILPAIGHLNLTSGPFPAA